MSIKNNIEKIIERANENQDIKGYDIVLSGYSVKVSPDKRDNFWNDLEDIQQDYNVTFSVTDYDDLAIYTSEYEGDMFRTGGVAGSKHVDVTKGYRLPHGYKAVRGEDKNKNYSKGKPKVRVDKGWRLPKGYEVVEGGYNKKYEDGGSVGISHYKVDGNIFIDYMDAISYCDKHNLPYSKIKKTKKYEDGGSVKGKKTLQQMVDHINNTYEGVVASKTYSDNRIQVVSPYFNTLSEIKRKEFSNNALMEKYGNTSQYVLYSNSVFEQGGNMNDCYCYEIGGL